MEYAAVDVNHMLTKSEAKQLVHQTTVNSLRSRPAAKLFQGKYSVNDYKKLDAAMTELANFIEKRGKLGPKTDASGEGGPTEVEVPVVREPEA